MHAALVLPTGVEKLRPTSGRRKAGYSAVKRGKKKDVRALVEVAGMRLASPDVLGWVVCPYLVPGLVKILART